MSEITTKYIVLLPRFKSANNEWIVPAYVDGKRSEDETYYTDDQEDAWATYFIIKKNFKDLNEKHQKP